MNKLLIGIILLLCSFTAKANTCTNLAYASIAADIASTYYAINTGNGVEGNPLIKALGKQDISFAMSGLLRSGLVYYINRKEKYWVNCVFASVTFGVAGNNLSIARTGEVRPEYVGVGLSIPFTVTSIKRLLR